MAEANKLSVLKECLEYERDLWKLCSKNYDRLEPMKGLEEQFAEQKAKCEILSDMIQALQNENVRRAMADWQKDLMEHGIQTELKFDEERYPKEYLPDHPEERGVSGRDDSLQHRSQVERESV